MTETPLFDVTAGDMRAHSGDAPARIIRRLFDGIVRFWRHRRAVADLRALDDQRLDDLGITRAQIEEAVRHSRPRSRSARFV